MKRSGPIAGLAMMLALPIAAVAQSAAPASPGKSAQLNVSMCTGCHTIPGYQASFPRVYRVPKISGQSAKYIEAALNGYKKGERNHPTMHAIAQDLSDTEIAALAAYYAERGSEGR
jgi:cytochrome c553